MKNIRPQKATMQNFEDAFFDWHPDIQAAALAQFAKLHRLKKRNMPDEPEEAPQPAVTNGQPELPL